MELTSMLKWEHSWTRARFDDPPDLRYSVLYLLLAVTLALSLLARISLWTEDRNLHKDGPHYI
jgi:hypothetical protein